MLAEGGVCPDVVWLWGVGTIGVEWDIQVGSGMRLGATLDLARTLLPLDLRGIIAYPWEP